MNWSTPTIISDVDLAFPAHALQHMPKWEELPHPFGDIHAQDHHPAIKLAKRLFMGPPLPPATTFISVEGVDAETAYRHLMMVLRSFAPSHEHKMGTAGYFISLWFKNVSTPDGEVLWNAGV